MANRKVVVDFIGQDKGFGAAADGMAKKSGGLGKSIGGLAKAFAGLYVIDKETDFLKESITAGREQQKVEAQTEAVIKSTGGAARVTAKEFGKLSHAISLKTGVDDDQIQAGENMLATFTQIQNRLGKGNDIFTQATKVSIDLGVAMKMGPAKAALQVGKALNDPLKGMARLGRIGVAFTDQQKKQVAQMVKVGDTAGAQKVILRELAKEFGGSAAAQATAADKFHNSINLLQQDIGKALIPVLDKMAKVGIKAVEWLQSNPKAMKSIMIGIAGIAVAFTAMFVAANIIPIAIGAVVAGLVYAWTHFETFRDIVSTTAHVIATAFTWLYNNVLRPIFKLILVDIGVQLIAWGKLISVMGHIPGFGWAKKLGDDMQTAGHKAIDLADNIHKIPGKHSTSISVPGMSGAISQARTLKALLSGTGLKTNTSTKSVPGMYQPKTKKKALGTSFYSGGPALVGEIGTELIFPPRGAQIIPHKESMAMLSGTGQATARGGDTYNISVSGFVGSETQLATAIQQILLKKKRQGGAALGLA